MEEEEGVLYHLASQKGHECKIRIPCHVWQVLVSLKGKHAVSFVQKHCIGMVTIDPVRLPIGPFTVRC